MSVRIEKVSQNIKRILCTVLIQEMNDPLLSLVTVTSVKVTADLKIAKIYVSVFNRDKRSLVLDELNNAKGRLKNKMSAYLKMKFMPDLIFFIDDTMDYVENINNLLKEIHKDDNQQNN